MLRVHECEIPLHQNRINKNQTMRQPCKDAAKALLV